MTNASPSPRKTAMNCIYYAVAVCFFLYLFHYYWTGAGGPILLALTLVPVTFVLFTLNALRNDSLYPKLPPIANDIIATGYIAIAAYISYYMTTEYEALGTWRAGMWDPADLVWGGLM